MPALPEDVCKPPYAKTKEGSHVATRNGYAVGRVIEEGEEVPAGIAVAESWMAPASPAKA